MVFGVVNFSWKEASYTRMRFRRWWQDIGFLFNWRILLIFPREGLGTHRADEHRLSRRWNVSRVVRAIDG